MKITLLKDHSTPEGYFKAGEEIDVDEATYDWLMGIYLSERQSLTNVVEAQDKKFEALRKNK